MTGEALWDSETRSFRGARLHTAIVARGWTVTEFARFAGLHYGSVYNAINSRPVRDLTAIRIFETLEKRRPMAVAGPGSAAA